MPLTKIARPLLFGLGLISVILGLIGAILPVMPTTPFLILAAYLFNKSSPRMHALLTSIPHFGSAILDWEQNKVIRPKAKLGACVTTVVIIGSSIIFAPVHYGLKLMLFFIGTGVIGFILTRHSGTEWGEQNEIIKDIDSSAE